MGAADGLDKAVPAAWRERSLTRGPQTLTEGSGNAGGACRSEGAIGQASGDQSPGGGGGLREEAGSPSTEAGWGGEQRLHPQEAGARGQGRGSSLVIEGAQGPYRLRKHVKWSPRRVGHRVTGRAQWGPTAGPGPPEG